MRVYAPGFFKDFHCIGSECSDNCCRMGWDIEIDQSTYDFYRSLDCGMCEHISSENGKHYIIQHDGQCPFLNENGLCSVVLEYAEEHISEICTQHPRFYQWFGGYKEAGTGLCCEESARLWLTAAGEITFTESLTNEPDDDLEFDPELLEAVLAARNALIGLLQSKDLTLTQKLKALLIFGLNAQELAEDDASQGFSELAQNFSNIQTVKGIISRLAEQTGTGDKLCACKQLIEYFEELDYMKEVFPKMLKTIKTRLPQLLEKAGELEKNCPQAEKQLTAVAVYNVYRYFIECARGAEALPGLAFCILNVWLVKLWDILLWLDGKFSLEAQIGAVKEFSKEIEYSDNAERIYEDVYMDTRLSAAQLLKITEV